jgi:hypothetical protein
MTERSIRYQTSFGLFEDDHEAFYRPRYLYRWDGARFASQLTQLSPIGDAAIGYGRGVTDSWSWSLYGAGGYTHEERLRSGQQLTLSGSRDDTAQSLKATSGAAGAPIQQGSAQGAFGLSRPLGGGQLGFGLQASWRLRSQQEIASAPFLFTLPSPGLTLRSDTTSISSLDESRLFSEENFVTMPRTESRSLRAAAVAGYSRRPSENGWGWSVDLLGGIGQTRDNASVNSRESAVSTSGNALQQYKSSTEAKGLSPLGGLAVTMLRGGNHPFWIDIGGEAEAGADVTGQFGTTTGRRQISMSTGDVQRLYELTETRTDRQNGFLNRRYLSTVGVRQSLSLDPLLQLGWGLHASWQQVRDENEITSAFLIDENLESNGNGITDAGDVRSRAVGQSRERFTRRDTTVLVTLPMALVIRSSTDAALEWRFGSELQYRNRLLKSDRRLLSMVLPSGLRAEGAGASSPTRFTNTSVSAGSRVSDRSIGLTTTVRAGVGYWFSPSAKVDFLASAAPSGDGFLNFDDRSFALSALLAF